MTPTITADEAERALDRSTISDNGLTELGDDEVETLRRYLTQQRAAAAELSRASEAADIANETCERAIKDRIAAERQLSRLRGVVAEARERARKAERAYAAALMPECHKHLLALDAILSAVGAAGERKAETCPKCKRQVASEAARGHRQDCICVECERDCFGEDTAGCRPPPGAVGGAG